MRTRIFALLAILLVAFATPSLADGKKKDKKKEKVTYIVSMTCENCKQRIEENIPFEKGVTDLKVDLPAKTVTIEYRADKTTPDKLKAAIQKLGYTAMPFHPKKEEDKN